MLSLKNISFSREKKILDNINITFQKGEIFGLVGPSGAGKSTLLKIIAGLLDADEGSITFNKQKVLGAKNKLIPGHSEIQLVNQDFQLDNYHNVYENVRLKCFHLPEKERNELIDELLQLVELNSLKHRKAIELSGGEQQRLALIRAMAIEPKVLLLDEPFVHLDPHLKEKIVTYLTLLNKIRKTTIILVTHDGQEVLSLSKRIAFFHEGKIKRISNPNSFYNEPTNSFEASFFGRINEISFKNNKIIFRPNQFELENKENHIKIEIKFIKSHYYGIYTFHEYKFKKHTLFLHQNNGENLSFIYLKIK